MIKPLYILICAVLFAFMVTTIISESIRKEQAMEQMRSIISLTHQSFYSIHKSGYRVSEDYERWREEIRNKSEPVSFKSSSENVLPYGYLQIPATAPDLEVQCKYAIERKMGIPDHCLPYLQKP